MLSKALFTVYLAIASFFGFHPDQPANVGANTVAQVFQGGTGTSSFPVGKCLKGNGKGAITTGDCGSGSSGAATTTINGVQSSNFTFATGSDANIKLSISTSSNTLTFTPYWNGTLDSSRIASSSYWDTAYSWGNHALYGYLTSSSIVNISKLSTSSNSGYVLQSNGNVAQWVSTSSLGIVGGGSSGATTTINGVNGPNFTFSTTSDTNLGVTISNPSGSTFNYAMNWLGTLADARITSSGNWNTAYTDRLKWDGGSTGLVAATGRTSLGLTDTATLASSTWLKVSNNLSDLNSSSTARTNLGLGDLAVLAVPASGIVTSNGSTLSNITDGSSNWNTAYTDRLKWDGGSTGLTAATGRTSLGLTDTATLASTTWYLSTNPSGYITSASLTPYLTTSTAATTYAPLAGSSTIITLGTVTTGDVGSSTIMNRSTPLNSIWYSTKEPTGFEDRTQSNISFSTTTRTLTISTSSVSSYNTFFRGKKFTYSTATSTTIPNSTNIYFVYFGPNGLIATSTSVWDIASSAVVPIATVYYNSTTTSAYLGEERHGITMDGMTHAYLHNTIGTRYQSGFVGTFNNTAGTTTAGIIWDEDLVHSWPQSTTFSVFNRNSSAWWDFTTASTTYYRTSGTTLLYDNGGASTTVPVNNYVAYWIMAGNSSTTPIVSVMGQRVDNNLSNARTNNAYSSLNLTNFPAQEFKVLYRVIMQNVAGTPTYIESQDLREVSAIAGSGTASLDHGTLAGLLDDDHPQYLLVDGSRTQTTLTVSGTSSFATTSIGTTSTTGLLNVGGYILTNALKVVGNFVAEFFGGIRNYAGYYDSSNATGTSGMVLTSTGTSTLWKAASGGSPQASTTMYSSTQTWTKPNGVTKIRVRVIGAGGTGGAGGANANCGGGGGGGGYSEKVIDVSAISTTSIYIGVTGSTTPTSFGNYASSTAGSTGQTNAYACIGGAGGQGFGGDLNLYGSSGGSGAGSAGNYFVGGSGGTPGGIGGGSGYGGYGFSTGGGGSGSGGVSCGGGGGGGEAGGSGGAGYNGCVIVDLLM